VTHAGRLAVLRRRDLAADRARLCRARAVGRREILLEQTNASRA
jgi:hypothetical protein